MGSDHSQPARGPPYQLNQGGRRRQSNQVYIQHRRPEGYPSVTEQASAAQQQQQQWQNGSSATVRFRAIEDQYNTIEEVQAALRRQGLESSNLIVAVDFTKSNEWQGKSSFHGRGLHTIGQSPNPYEGAITIIGRTLRSFDDDNLIPAYGFGDATTGDHNVFSFVPNDQPCQGLDSVLWRYRELAPYVNLAGPTSFAPAINQAVKAVVASGGQYHILLIVADGQVTRGSDLPEDRLSAQEHHTIQAITNASHYPLSIIMVGVGDGPWDVMKEFDDRLPSRTFDNFQFVNFTETQREYGHDHGKLEAMFALRALMEIPEQYKTIRSLGLLGGCPPLHTSVPQPLQPPLPYEPAEKPRVSQPQKEKQQQQQAAPSASESVGTLQKAGSSGINTLFLCPITQDMMQDPVIATDGYTYERTAISNWLLAHDTSPMTNQRMPGPGLIPNHTLRSSIMEFSQRK